MLDNRIGAEAFGIGAAGKVSVVEQQVGKNRRSCQERRLVFAQNLRLFGTSAHGFAVAVVAAGTSTRRSRQGTL